VVEKPGEVLIGAAALDKLLQVAVLDAYECTPVRFVGSMTLLCLTVITSYGAWYSHIAAGHA
jgi:hypothetical protein